MWLVDESNAQFFGTNLRSARQAAGLSQAWLAKAAKVPRLRVVRAETGHYILKLDEVIRLAEVLRVPLERLTTGRWRPGNSLREIAFELFHLGIRDLEVSAPNVPGSFRAAEQVVTSALKGDCPEPRVVDAIPFVLARHKLNVPLAVAFAELYDPRLRTRLAWLSDVTLTLHQLSTFTVEVKSEAQLREFVRAGVKSAQPDSLGHPREGKPPRLWARWNITYVGDLSDFLRRVKEVEIASRLFPSSLESEE